MINEVQTIIITTVRSSLRQEGQNVIPKLNKSDQSKNWGFSKECKLYDLPKGSHLVILTRENGASIVGFSNRKFKGMQPINVLLLSTGRYYSSKVSRTSKSEETRTIECSYKQLFDIELYKTAYITLKSKPGNMTPGVDKETLDNISLE
jgi:hypothetical protein